MAALPPGAIYDTPTGVGGKIDTSTGKILSGSMTGQTAAVQTPNPATAFSSTAGAAALTKSTAQATKLAGTPYSPAAVPAPPATDQTPSSVTLVKADTGQEYTLTSPDPSTLMRFTANGWHVAEGTGNGAGVAPVDPHMQAAQDATNQAKGELDNAKSKLASFSTTLGSDPMLAKIMSSITADWDARMEQMSKYNESATADMRTTAIRHGMQYTGGAGGTWGGVISAEERFGVQRLAELEAEKHTALTNASLAYEKQKWSEYSDQVDKAQNAYDTQVTELQKLQGASQAQSDKVAAAKRQSDLEGVLGDVVKQGITNPGDIQKYLRATGASDVSLKEINDALKILSPAADLTGLSADYRTYQHLVDTGSPAVKGLDYLGYVRAVHNAARANGAGGGSGTGAGGSGTGGGAKVTWDAYLAQQEQKMQANIAPGSKLYNDLHTQWEQLSAPAGKSPFTVKDQANGAQNAGLSIASFPALPVDVQNFYVKAPQAQINAVNKEFAAIRAGTETAANAKKWVASSQITDTMKDYLNRKIDEIGSTTPAGSGTSGGGLVNGIEHGLGSGWHALTNFLGI